MDAEAKSIQIGINESVRDEEKPELLLRLERLVRAVVPEGAHVEPSHGHQSDQSACVEVKGVYAHPRVYFKSSSGQFGVSVLVNSGYRTVEGALRHWAEAEIRQRRNEIEKVESSYEFLGLEK